MPRTRINCPNCRQPITADVTQLFDVGVDPAAKQQFLSGAFNVIQCPNCGYQGQLSTPIVYHDPNKELLLSFMPPEMGLPRNEQERVLGGLINQAINSLPQEKRKGYLLRPQETLTLQGLIERVLEAEGITKEMIQAQQQRLNLLQRLAEAADPAAREQLAKQEDALIDSTFFALLRRLMEASMMQGDQQSAQVLAGLQESLMQTTTFGKELAAQSKEVETAVNDLRALGRELNREKLLDLVEHAPNEIRLRALVSMARPGMDYNFFQMLSERIDKASGDDRARLTQLREKLLAMTREIDQQMETRAKESREMVNTILAANNIEEALMQNLQGVDDFFVQELNNARDAARKAGDLERSSKAQQVLDLLQDMSTPPEMRLVEELLDAPDEAAQRKLMEAHADEVNEEFLGALTNLSMQVQQGEDRELSEKLANLNRLALRFSMERNLKT